jgi:hypothetical protein
VGLGVGFAAFGLCEALAFVAGVGFGVRAGFELRVLDTDGGWRAVE